MNVLSRIATEGETGPLDQAIVVRDLRFNRADKPGRHWIDNPVANAWHNALSATFPRGEAFFIESVRQFREGTPPRLDAEIRDFIRQEVNHSREHLAFNRTANEAGYDYARIEDHITKMLDMAKGRPPIFNLAATMALEHYTAILARLLLENPELMAHAEPGVAAMWRWHAIEEIEHKAVAYDTWLHATRDWPRPRRWLLKTMMMLKITRNFVPQRIRDTLDLLAQDGITGWKAKARVFWYLFGKPGVLRRLTLPWLAYFLPGFHPWRRDERALIAAAEAGLESAA